MKYKTTIVICLLTMLSTPCFANDITLYACVKKGETTLSNIRENDCDKITTYRYQSNVNHPQGESLRPQEQSLNQQFTSPMPNEEMQQQRYQHVDDRVGWAYSNDYRDTMNDKCAYYRVKLHSLLATLGATEPNEFKQGTQYQPNIEQGDVKTAQWDMALKQLEAQVKYYCD